MQTSKNFLLGACAGLGLIGTASAQWGTVTHHEKISELTAFFPTGGIDANDQMGRAVICPGDIDGDGNPDLVSGAIGDDDGGVIGIDSDTGALWVHFLDKTGFASRNSKISMTRGGFTARLDTRDQFGRALEKLGDFDGDGVPDIAAGSSRDDDGGVNRGAIYLLCLKRDGTVKTQHKISSTQGGFLGALDDHDEFGRAIANLGDLDGNGTIDLAVGSIGDDDGGVESKGAVWVLFLNADGSVLSHQKISDTEGDFQGALGGGDIFGFSLETLSDLDQDGVPELLVGAPKDDDGGVRKGAVWLLFLRADGTVKSHKKISDVGGLYGMQPTGEFGSSMADLGDLDGDHVPDVAIGVPLDSGTLEDQGAVFVNLMNADGSVKSKVKINALSGGFTGELGDSDWFGMSLDAIPDLDGDGIGELAVGARFDDDGSLNSGSVWILHLRGVANVPPTPGFVALPPVGKAPVAVQFEDRSSAGAREWDWDFGDGTTSTQQHPLHVYDQPGEYTVTLQVGGPGGTTTLVVPEAVIAQHAASFAYRNGLGINPTVLSTQYLPKLGGILHAEVDTTQISGAGVVIYMASNKPYSLQLSAGELLIQLPGLGGSRLFRQIAGSHGVRATFGMAIPNDPALAGLTAYTQAIVYGASRTYTNALDFTLGY